MKILVTGSAGFIGFHVALSLLKRGEDVIGVDNLNDYYDVALKKARLKELNKFDKNNKNSSFNFVKLDISSTKDMKKLFVQENFDAVINLAAQAGVRYSIENPYAYINSNIIGFMNILEGCRHNDIQHLVYASSSSVYGSNEKLPFSVSDSVDHPLSLYAATKKSNELMAHTYSSLYNLPTTGLRFFTVYGPWGRPDMALFTFTKSILAGDPINVFNHGNHKRDFTYIDDIVEGVVSCLDSPAQPNKNWDGKNPDPGTSKFPWKVYNIGNSSPVELGRYIELLEKELGKSAKQNFLPMQLGDVPNTSADVSSLAEDIGYSPNTPVEEGIRKFAIWYKEFYRT